MVIAVAEFKINYYQYLNENGDIVAPLPFDHTQLIERYKTMVLTRVFDLKAIALQRTGQLGTFPSSLGQEAVSTGIGYALKPEDVFSTYYRDYAAQMMRGVSLEEILLYWSGSERGNDYQNPLAKEDLPACVPIASQYLHAAGVATAFKLRKQARAALVTCGDGATSQGDFYETVNVAGAWQLPLVMIVTNNQWAISVPRSLQSHAQTLAQKGIAGGVDSEQVDGNDVIAVEARIALALKKARENKGPTLIEAITYRLSDHTTADDASRYREKNEMEQAWKNEPISRLKNYLISQNSWSEEEEKNWLNHCSEKIEQAVKNYLSTSPEPMENMFKFHYDKPYHIS
jgi:2-oxoisovalerate dehydrogenase E1 component alpha subunit